MPFYGRLRKQFAPQTGWSDQFAFTEDLIKKVMTLSEVIIQCEQYSPETFVYSQNLNDTFLATAEAVVIELDEDELEENTFEIAKKKCPGHYCFLEMSIIQDMYSGLKTLEEYSAAEKRVERIIHYAENDA